MRRNLPPEALSDLLTQPLNAILAVLCRVVARRTRAWDDSDEVYT